MFFAPTSSMTVSAPMECPSRTRNGAAALAVCPFQCRANIEKARLLCRRIGDQRPQSSHKTVFPDVRSAGPPFHSLDDS